jgi:type VI protein secretion system component VasF
MAKRQFPDLATTSRRYLADTQRARLASPGLERYGVRRRRPARVVVAAVAALAALAALVGLMLWLARS